MNKYASLFTFAKHANITKMWARFAVYFMFMFKRAKVLRSGTF